MNDQIIVFTINTDGTAVAPQPGVDQEILHIRDLAGLELNWYTTQAEIVVLDAPIAEHDRRITLEVTVVCD